MAGSGRILVVDDDPLNRKLLAKSLERDGHEVHVAAGGAECLATLATTPVDVVLLDILMPDLDGFQVLERIKDDPELRHIPVVMISGLEDIESVVRCIEMGAEDFLPKPFDPVILRARVNAGLDRMRLHQLERDRVRDVFARFLPETVVDEVLARSGGELRLGAERMVGTVMFTDLRSFTTFAETTPAERVIEVLNRYLGDMGGAVLDHGGTLVDYMGDGIMAAFGAPIPTDDHADRAIAAAREMVRERLPEFNRWLVAEGLCDGFGMGIGLNTGPVMSGNVGSERRLEYTVIGDTVNTASRIEALTKEVPFPVLVADETRAAMRSTSEDLVYVDEFEIRGKRTRSKLWGLQGG
jgi:adenylate cyclase